LASRPVSLAVVSMVTLCLCILTIFEWTVKLKVNAEKKCKDGREDEMDNKNELKRLISFHKVRGNLSLKVKAPWIIYIFDEILIQFFFPVPLLLSVENLGTF